MNEIVQQNPLGSNAPASESDPDVSSGQEIYQPSPPDALGEGYPPDTTNFSTLADDPEILAQLRDIHTTQQDTNNIMVFLIGVICGVVFIKSLLKGWLDA